MFSDVEHVGGFNGQDKIGKLDVVACSPPDRLSSSPLFAVVGCAAASLRLRVRVWWIWRNAPRRAQGAVGVSVSPSHFRVNLNDTTMADRQGPEGTETVPINSGSDDSPRYFCYQCNKEVTVEGSQDALTCAECQGGFLEAIATVHPDFRRPSRRRRRRTPHGDANTVSLSDALEHMYPHQMLQMVQILLEAARTNRRQPTDATTEDGTAPQVEEGEVQTEPSVEAGGLHAADALPNEGRVVIVRERHLGQDDNSEEAESDSETGGLRLELEGFDLNEDDDEWEEAEDDEDGMGTGTRNELDVAEELGDREERVRRARSNLNIYMRELFQNLMDQNVEVRVELPDMYLGNPGDYLDSRGFEQLLQQLAENDNSRRGAPPAGKSAVDQLPFVKIEQHHIDSGIAVCAICKEVLTLDEPAKQLPCLHLYHQDCILPWLSSRNSCPVCRYELPTDDPDYEEQKKSRRTEGASGDSGSVGTEEDESSDRGQNSGGSSASASEEICGDGVHSENVMSTESSGNTVDRDSQGDASRGMSRSWLMFAVGPLLSVMGFMFLSLGNHLAGRQLDRLQLNPFHEFQMFQLGGSNDVPGHRHWWSFH